MKTIQQRLFVAAILATSAISVSAGELVPLAPTNWPITSSMSGARHVEIMNIQHANDMAKVSARLTMRNGMRMNCEYTMVTQMDKGEKLLRIDPHSETCSGGKGVGEHKKS